MMMQTHVAGMSSNNTMATQSTAATSTPQGLNSSNIDAAKIFVGGLSWQTTEETLRYHFEQYGDVLSVEIMKDRNTGDPRGFAFVVFRSDDTVQLILNEKPHEIDRKIVDVKRAQARGFAPPSIHPGQLNASESKQQHGQKQNNYYGNKSNTNNTNETNTGAKDGQTFEMNKVFVGGLPLHYSKEDLNSELSVYGQIADSIVMMDPINRTRSRGFGFVTFASSEFAKECIKHQPINMNGKMVEVKLAMPRGTHQNSQNNNSEGGYHGNPSHMNSNNNTSSNKSLFQKQSSSQPTFTTTASKGKYAGLAATYGKNGWKAGYGTNAFGKMGWNVEGWEDYNIMNEGDDKFGGRFKGSDGFSFSFLNTELQGEDVQDDRKGENLVDDERQLKRPKY